MNRRACSTVLFFAATLVTSGSSAAPITHQAIIQPYQVCYDGDCADVSRILDGSVEAFADAVFLQVGLDIEILTPLVLHTTPEDGAAEHLTRFADEAGYGSLAGRTDAPLFIDSSFGPTGTVGVSWIGAAGMVVAELPGTTVFLPTIASELGHNLGLLNYFDEGVGATSNLMDNGLCYSAELADVSPTILLCELLPAQIAQVQAFLVADSTLNDWIVPLAVPAPPAAALVACALLGLRGSARRAGGARRGR